MLLRRRAADTGFRRLSQITGRTPARLPLKMRDGNYAGPAIGGVAAVRTAFAARRPSAARRSRGEGGRTSAGRCRSRGRRAITRPSGTLESDRGPDLRTGPSATLQTVAAARNNSSDRRRNQRPRREFRSGLLARRRRDRRANQGVESLVTSSYLWILIIKLISDIVSQSILTLNATIEAAPAPEKRMRPGGGRHPGQVKCPADRSATGAKIGSSSVQQTPVKPRSFPSVSVLIP